MEFRVEANTVKLPRDVPWKRGSFRRGRLFPLDLPNEASTPSMEASRLIRYDGVFCSRFRIHPSLTTRRIVLHPLDFLSHVAIMPLSLALARLGANITLPVVVAGAPASSVCLFPSPFIRQCEHHVFWVIVGVCGVLQDERQQLRRDPERLLVSGTMSDRPGRLHAVAFTILWLGSRELLLPVLPPATSRL